FQANRCRQLASLLGAKRHGALARYGEGTQGRQVLERRFREPTVWDAFLQYLAREGYPVPPSQLSRDHTQPVSASLEMQDILVSVYRNDVKNAELCERLIDLDEG